MRHICVLFITLLLVSNIYGQEKFTKDLSLKQALEIGLNNHPEVQKSRQKIELNKGRFFKDISPPPLNVSISNEFIPSGSGLSNFDERTFEITQGFEFPTIYFAKGSRANSEIKASEYGFEQTQNSIKTQIKKAYFNAQAKQMLLKTAEENLQIASDFYKKAEIRYNVGEGSNLELLTSKTQFTEANAMISLAKREYHTALNHLNFILGYNLEVDFQNIKFSDSLAYIKMSLTLDELINKSLLTNPALKKANTELESSEINKSIASMSYLPSFNASYLFQSRNSNNGYYGFRLGLSLPLWFMFDQKGKVQEANANYMINTYELQNIKNYIVQSINNAFVDFVNDDIQIQLYKNELLPQAEEIFKTANLSYQAGEISYLEFLQAKFTTINTRTNYIKSLYDFKEAIINLEESTSIILE